LSFDVLSRNSNSSGLYCAIHPTKSASKPSFHSFMICSNVWLHSVLKWICWFWANGEVCSRISQGFVWLGRAGTVGHQCQGDGCVHKGLALDWWHHQFHNKAAVLDTKSTQRSHSNPGSSGKVSGCVHRGS
jgi:hypothetical protein